MIMDIKIGDIVRIGRRTNGKVIGISQDLYNPCIIWVYVRRIIGGKNKRYDTNIMIIDLDILRRLN